MLIQVEGSGTPEMRAPAELKTNVRFVSGPVASNCAVGRLKPYRPMCPVASGL